MSVLHLTVQVLFETRLKTRYPTAWQWQSTDLTMTTLNFRTPNSSVIPCCVGWVIREVTELEFHSSNLSFTPSENTGGLPKVCKLPTVLSRAKHSCSFPSHTRSFHPNSTVTVSQTSVLHWWCQWSLGHSVFLISFTLLVNSYSPSQACHLFSINIYLLVLTLFHYCCVTCPTFVKYISDPFSSCGDYWVVRSSLILRLPVTPFFWTCSLYHTYWFSTLFGH
jgi:hypothetical protein